MEGEAKDKPKNLEIATLAGGCFWCTEALYQRIQGVVSVVPGYTGGETKSPTYEQVCAGTTGHAEAIQVTFDPAITTYENILNMFFHLHDPTQLNRQGNDVGTQYRSAIFYHNEEQRSVAEEQKAKVEASKTYKEPIVTEIMPFKEFYQAEDYHKDYFNQNNQAPYCQLVITPKLDKLYHEYKDKTVPGPIKPPTQR